MAVLMIDVGNSCLKYCLLGSLNQPVTEVVRLPEYGEQQGFLALLAILPASLDEVAVSCVGREPYLQALIEALAPRCKGKIRVAAVENHWGGFELGYADVSRLGVDRWLAMLAVRPSLKNGNQALLADCGTAITVESFSRDKHLGGVIAPGLRLMAKALNTHTADLPMAEAGSCLVTGGWAHSTEQAISSGCFAAAEGILERQYRCVEDVQTAWLTGGDAGLLSKNLPNWQWVPELVLEGLRVWVRG